MQAFRSFVLLTPKKMPIQIDRRKLQQLGRLELLAKQAVEGFITGLHKSPFHGFSVEFAEHRPYNTGESTRHLDWKLFGRTDKLFIKRYEEETNLRCHLVLDVSGSMFFPSDVPAEGDRLNKLKFSIYCSAVLMEMFKRQRDAVGLTVFSDRTELHTKASASGAHHNYLFSELEKLFSKFGQPAPQGSHVTEVLHELAEKIHTRSLVIIFSDMMENTSRSEELFSAMQHLRHNKHEVILFHVVDRQLEVNFQFENRPYTFVDMESGTEIKVNPNDIRTTYLERMSAFKKNLQLKCGQYHIDFVEADIHEGFNPILLQYMIKRQKMA
jgi:uncharacterized protein (DUF58 family)